MGTQRLPVVDGTAPPTTTESSATGGGPSTGDDLLGYSDSTILLMSPSSSTTAASSTTTSPSHPHLMIDQKLPLGNNKTPSVLNHDNLRIKSVLVRRYLKHNPLINCLLPLSCICAVVVIVYLLKDFPRHALAWIEERQEADSWTLVGWFMVLFVIVSFPVTVGYLVLLITSGYLFGFLQGLLVVVVGANFGVAVAHYVIKSLQNKLPVHK